MCEFRFGNLAAEEVVSVIQEAWGPAPVVFCVLGCSSKAGCHKPPFFLGDGFELRALHLQSSHSDWVLVAPACNPSYSEGWQFKASLCN
jgi:hypothetical protein